MVSATYIQVVKQSSTNIHATLDSKHTYTQSIWVSMAKS